MAIQPSKGMSPAVRNPLVTAVLVILLAILAYPVGRE